MEVWYEPTPSFDLPIQQCMVRILLRRLALTSVLDLEENRRLSRDIDRAHCGIVQ